MQKIHFYFHDRNPILKDRKKLKVYIENLFISEKKGFKTLAYIFCSDKYLLEINKGFLKHDFYTDVITFDLSEIKTEIEGEIYISIDRINENAKGMGISFTDELHRVIFHGALHLCGYKDKNKTDQSRMRLAENRYLKQYFK
ncbi:MAG: rRNA maturation RNase YbeY [Ferruginibacter sp.]